MHEPDGQHFLPPPSPHRARVVIGVVVSLSLIGTICTVLRILARNNNNKKKNKQSRGVKRGLLVDDYLVAAAQVLIYGLAAASILETVFWNAEQQDIQESSGLRARIVKLFLAFQIIYNLAMALLQLSICLLFQQVFPSRVLHTLSWILLAAILSWSTGSILFELLACRPLAALWSTSTTHASAACMKDRTIPYMVMGVGDIVIDTAILIIGAIGVWKLEVSTRNVLALGFLFSMGPCVMAMSTLRTIALLQASALFETLTESYFVIWSLSGVVLCQFVVCAPFFPLVRRQDTRKRSGDIELRTLSSQFHCVGELDGDSEERLGTAGSDWAVRVERGADEHGSYIFTHMLESGHWNTTLRSDEDGSKSDLRG